MINHHVLLLSDFTDVQCQLKGIGKPCLVLALNGMRNFDLTAEISQQILNKLGMLPMPL